MLGIVFNKGNGMSLICSLSFHFVLLNKSCLTHGLSCIKGVAPKPRGQHPSSLPFVYSADYFLRWATVPIP